MMTITVEMLIQVISILGSVIGVIWYISSLINSIKSDLASVVLLNEQQEKKLDAMESSIEKKVNIYIEKNTEIGTQCRDGRIKVWEDLNALKVTVAQIQAKVEK
jgi:hypothetical protein